MTGIYIHIPFCLKKCNYCDFVSLDNLKLIPSYLKALKTEISLSGALYNEPVDTIFIGGGTPGVLETRELNALLLTLKYNFNISNNAEITIETNPAVLTPQKADDYLKSGINRISIGLQSSQNELLKLLGRMHNVNEFDAAYNIARIAGFENINVDLIYGIPTQNLDQWLETLYHVLYLKPEHISCYSLKIEEKTPLYNDIYLQKIPNKDEDGDADQYLAAANLLAEKGYINYEISNFAQYGRECRHNLKYWNLQNYLGLGVSAHSNIEKLRFSNTGDIKRYIKQMETGSLHYESSHFINDKERIFEYIMLKTRLKDGIDFKHFKETFNIDLKKTFAEQMDKARYTGLCKISDDKLVPTLKGFMFQNTLIHILTQNL